jgi:hypothetical protein
MRLGGIFAALFCLFVQSTAANATNISVKPIGDSPNNVYSFYIDGGAANGAFDTIFFEAKAFGGASFINLNSGAFGGVPRPAGELFTYPNRMLTADPLDFPGGLGLTQVGLVNNGHELSYTAGKLGGTITTAAEPQGDLFLGNVLVSPGHYLFYNGFVHVQLISAGNVIFDETIGTPEPAGLSIAALGFTGLVAVRRRCCSAAMRAMQSRR